MRFSSAGELRWPEEDRGFRVDDVALMLGLGERRRRDDQEKEVQPERRARERSPLAAIGALGHYRTQERAASQMRCARVAELLGY